MASAIRKSFRLGRALIHADISYVCVYIYIHTYLHTYIHTEVLWVQSIYDLGTWALAQEADALADARDDGSAVAPRQGWLWV